MQDIFGIIKSLFLFSVISGFLRQFPRPLTHYFLRFSDTIEEFGRVSFKQGSSVEP